MRRPASALAFLLAAALAGGCDSSPRIERLDIQDLPAPAMFQEVALKFRRAYVLELPAERKGDRHDLALDRVTMNGALDAIEALDPQYQWSARGEVLVFWPKEPKELQGSPYSQELKAFSASGGAGEVIRLLLVETGLADSTNLFVETAGLRRPVTLQAHSGSLRDAFIEVARQAHLGFMLAPGVVDVEHVAQ